MTTRWRNGSHAFGGWRRRVFPAILAGLALAASAAVESATPSAEAAASAASLPAAGASDCRVEYGWNSNGAFPGMLVHQKDSVDLATGETRTLNRDRLDYVLNLKAQPVEVTLSNKTFELGQDARDPPSWSPAPYYVGSFTLVRLKCLAGSGTPAFGGPAQLIDLYKQSGAPLEDIAKALSDLLGLAEQQVAEALKAAGYGAAAVAGALKSAFNAGDSQVAQWLKDAGYNGMQVASALRSPLNFTATAAATWLKNAYGFADATVAQAVQGAGYTGAQLAEALRDALNYTAVDAAAWLKTHYVASNQVIAGWLKDAGYPGAELAGALRSAFDYPATAAATWLEIAFGVSEQQVTHWLHAAGYAGAEVAQALKDAFDAAVEQARQWLEAAFGAVAEVPEWLAAAGYPSPEWVVGGLISIPVGTGSAPQTAEQLIAQLVAAGASIAEIAGALQDVLGLNADQIAAALRAAGYPADEIAGLFALLGVAASDVARWLKDAGFPGSAVAFALRNAMGDSATDAANALKTAFGVQEFLIAQWLQGAGYGGAELAAALKDAFDFNATQVANWLKTSFGASDQVVAGWLEEAGYTGDRIAIALRSAFGFSATANAMWLKSAFDVPELNVMQWLEIAGYHGGQAAEALKNAFDATLAAAGEWLAGAFEATAETLAQWLQAAGYPAEIQNVIDRAHRDCRYWQPNENPLYLQATGAASTITLRGNIVIPAVTAIEGLPSGADHDIRERGSCFIIVDITVPTHVAEGTAGTATLRFGNSDGPDFNWVVGPKPPIGGGVRDVARPGTQTGTDNPPPDVTLSPGQIIAPQEGDVCVSTTGAYGSGVDDPLVAFFWQPDPVAATRLEAGWVVTYEVQIENREQGGACQGPAAWREEPGGCTWIMETPTETARPLGAGDSVAWRVRSTLMWSPSGNPRWPQFIPARTGDWSPWTQFRVAPQPHPPEPDWPVNDYKVTGPSQTHELRWKPNACEPDAYWVRIERPDGTTGEYLVGKSTEYNLYVDMQGKWRWSVRMRSEAGVDSDWSESRVIDRS